MSAKHRAHGFGNGDRLVRPLARPHIKAIRTGECAGVTSRRENLPTGELILLENQDRSLWNREQIAEGLALLRKALKSRRFGAYTLQAAIAAVHAEAESAAATDWRQIVALYDRLLRIHPSPVVQLNRAVAIAMCDGPEAGLAQIDAVLEHGELANYYLGAFRPRGYVPQARQHIRGPVIL
jgi:RNA polymerase sigma-70 factor (ECF subfamily)